VNSRSGEGFQQTVKVAADHPVCSLTLTPL
jgi:hypothetical protein